MTDQPSHPSPLEQHLVRMRTPPKDPKAEFHAITLTADVNGVATYSTHTHWVGWHGEGHRVELRQSSLVTLRYTQVWDDLNLPYVFVKDAEDVLVFLLLGGNALVERTIAEHSFKDLLKPRPSYPHGRAGFIGESVVQKTALRRAPTPKLRMAVLERDKRRCRICGRRPDDDTDIVLHVHHIRPWEHGGITDISNLITLCHSCHSGLEPHFDRSLFDYVEQSDALALIASFHERVANYRRQTSTA